MEGCRSSTQPWPAALPPCFAALQRQLGNVNFELRDIITKAKHPAKFRPYDMVGRRAGGGGSQPLVSCRTGRAILCQSAGGSAGCIRVWLVGATAPATFLPPHPQVEYVRLEGRKFQCLYTEGNQVRCPLAMAAARSCRGSFEHRCVGARHPRCGSWAAHVLQVHCMDPETYEQVAVDT